MNTESTVEDTLKNVPRFRLLCVGRAGVGKSSLINDVFGISEAPVCENASDEATIDEEFVSAENKYFVLHDSGGFGSGDDIDFDPAARFLRERHNKEHLKDRIHAIWLCIETPRASSQVLREGHKKLLALALELQTPVVIVFTKYDVLVRSKKSKGTKGREDGSDEEISVFGETMDVGNPFGPSAFLRSGSAAGLKTPIPYIAASVFPGYEESITSLVDMTYKLVHERLKGDACVTWAIAQRSNLPMKITLCVDKGVNFCYRALTGSDHVVGGELLWQCLAQIHQDIVTCWNFKDEDKILGGTEFHQLILYLVEELHTRTPTTSPPPLDKIGQFANLATASTIPVLPPGSILGLTYDFVKWISDTVVRQIPEIECLLMAYAVDLILALKSLSDFSLPFDLDETTGWKVSYWRNNSFVSQERRPCIDCRELQTRCDPFESGKTNGPCRHCVTNGLDCSIPREIRGANWQVLEDAFKDYAHSDRRREIHACCRSMYDRNYLILTREDFHQQLNQLLGESLGLEVHDSKSGTR